MKGIAAVAAIELKKLLGQRTFFVATLIVLLGWKLLALAELSAAGASAALEGFRLNGFYLMAHSALYGLATWVVLLYVMATQLVAAEAERGHMRLVLVRPVGRGAFYFGKLAALAVLVLAAVALDAVLGTALGGAALGFGDVADVELQGAQYAARAIAGDLAAAYFATGLAALATAAVGLCISALFQQATTATTVGLLVLVAAAAIGFLFGDPLADWLFTTYDTRAFDPIEKLTAGTSVYREPGGALRAVLVPLATLIASSALGSAVFARRDVTT